MNATDQPTVHLIGVGRVPAVPATLDNLQPGGTIVFNYGETATIDNVVPKGARSMSVEIVSKTGEHSTMTKRIGTLTAYRPPAGPAAAELDRASADAPAQAAPAQAPAQADRADWPAGVITFDSPKARAILARIARAEAAAALRLDEPDELDAPVLPAPVSLRADVYVSWRSLHRVPLEDAPGALVGLYV